MTKASSRLFFGAVIALYSVVFWPNHVFGATLWQQTNGTYKVNWNSLYPTQSLTPLGGAIPFATTTIRVKYGGIISSSGRVYVDISEWGDPAYSVGCNGRAAGRDISSGFQNGAGYTDGDFMDITLNPPATPTQYGCYLQLKVHFGAGNYYLYADASSGSAQPYFVISDEGGVGLYDEQSRIDSFQPALGSTTASTSVAFSASGYNESGHYERVAFQYLGDSPGTISGMTEVSISSGYYGIAFVDDLPAGQYWGWVRMIDTSGDYMDVAEAIKFRVATTDPQTMFLI